MGKILLAILIGLVLGAGALWWWQAGHPRALAQVSDRLAGWAVITRADGLASGTGGTTWSVAADIRLHNLSTRAVKVTLPAQRFLVVLGDGSTVVGSLPEATTAAVAPQQTASVTLPVVSFVSRSQEVANVLFAFDEGDGLRVASTQVGEEPKPKEAPKPEAPAPAK